MNEIEISLTTLLVCSPQQIVLTQRHGMDPEDSDNTFAVRQQLYRSIESLTQRELSFCPVIEHAGLRVRLPIRRLYHHDNCIYRVQFTDEKGMAVRNRGPKQREVNLLAVAGFLAAEFYSVQPTGLRYLIHVTTEDPEKPFQESKEFEIAMPKRDDVAALLFSKVEAVAQALELDDEQQHPCSSEQRYTAGAAPTPDFDGCLSAASPLSLRSDSPEFEVQEGMPMKCLDWCPARQHCPQHARFMAHSTSVLKKIDLL